MIWMIPLLLLMVDDTTRLQEAKDEPPYLMLETGISMSAPLLPDFIRSLLEV